MANFAYLLGSDHGDVFEHDRDVALLSGRYLVPALWLASFEPGNLRYHEDEDGRFPWLQTTALAAQATFLRRLDALSEHVTNAEEFAPAWLEFLKRLEHRHLKAHVQEILWMTEDAEAEFLASLSALDDRDPRNVQAFLRTSCLSDVLDPETLRVQNPRAQTVGQLFAQLGEEPDEPDFAQRILRPTPAVHHLFGCKEVAWCPWEAPEDEYLQECSDAGPEHASAREVESPGTRERGEARSRWSWPRGWLGFYALSAFAVAGHAGWLAWQHGELAPDATTLLGAWAALLGILLCLRSRAALPVYGLAAVPVLLRGVLTLLDEGAFREGMLDAFAGCLLLVGVPAVRDALRDGAER